MRPISPVVAILLLLLLSPNQADAQGVIIRGATPAEVVAVLNADLQPQGFALVKADDKTALFTLDRGMVAQQGGRGAVHVILELRFRFKAKSEGLQVTASEEVVGGAGTTLEYRKPVESRVERQNLQRLLDKAREGLEARPASGDSAASRDSSPS